MARTAPIAPRLADPDLERVRREHDAKIRELQAQPAASTRIVSNVSLADGVETPVAHGLGRAPKMVIVSPPRGPSSSGRIEEVRQADRTKTVTLEANGWGATITVDVEFK